MGTIIFVGWVVVVGLLGLVYLSLRELSDQIIEGSLWSGVLYFVGALVLLGVAFVLAYNLVQL